MISRVDRDVAAALHDDALWNEVLALHRRADIIDVLECLEVTAADDSYKVIDTRRPGSWEYERRLGLLRIRRAAIEMRLKGLCGDPDEPEKDRRRDALARAVCLDYQSGWGLRSISAKYSISSQRAKDILVASDVALRPAGRPVARDPHRTRAFARHEVDAVVRCAQTGISCEEISVRFGTTTGHLFEQLRRFGVDPGQLWRGHEQVPVPVESGP